MDDDAELLRRFAETGAQDAFTEFVHRHITLVYAAARRRLGGDAHGAADVTQQVFISAARDARSLARHPRLTGWLYATTRHAAINAMRTEIRRRRRELEANQSNALHASDAESVNWDHLRPVLDTAMDELGRDDREAVLMRFFENRAFREIADRLRTTENAARMRVERALSKLEGILRQRGVSSTSSALAAVLTRHGPGVAAEVPVGLATSVVSSALASGSGSILGLGGFETFVIMNSKAIIGSTVAIIAAALIGVTARQHTQRVAAKRETVEKSRATVVASARDISTMSTSAVVAPLPGAAPPAAQPSRIPYSREEAKRYLDGLVSQIYPKGMPVPDLDFRPEDKASADEMAQIIAARQAAANRGTVLIVARTVDGALHTSESGAEFPRELVPEHVRANLTEADWEAFQVSMQVATLLKRGFGRSNTSESSASNKMPAQQAQQSRLVQPNVK